MYSTFNYMYFVHIYVYVLFRIFSEWLERFVPEMTYYVSSGTLNCIHSVCAASTWRMNDSIQLALGEAIIAQIVAQVVVGSSQESAHSMCAWMEPFERVTARDVRWRRSSSLVDGRPVGSVPCCHHVKSSLIIDVECTLPGVSASSVHAASSQPRTESHRCLVSFTDNSEWSLGLTR